MATVVDEKVVDISQQITGELRQFLSGCGRPDTGVSQSALYLLRTLPCSRDAVLQHLCVVFDESVYVYLQQKTEAQQKSSEVRPVSPVLQNEGFLFEVEDLLLSYIKGNAAAWCPVISAWALDLLGAISRKYAQHQCIKASSLNESLQVWMNCTPTKILLNVTSKCFSTMIGGDPISSVASLLDASVRYSPHFDWVVAHIGSCFPQTIIERVLLVGLKEFHHHFMDRGPATKINSVVAIVGHLASHHRNDIWMALLDLFQTSLNSPQAPEMQCIYVIPYILTLMSMSHILLDIITNYLRHTLTNDVLNKISVQFAGKPELDAKATLFMDLVHFLLTKVNKSAYQCVHFLLDILDSQSGPSKLKSNIKSTCLMILNKLLLQLHRSVFTTNTLLQEIPLLLALQDYKHELCTEMLAANNKRVYWLSRLLICVAGFGPISIAGEILAEIIISAKTPEHLSIVYDFESIVRCRHVDVLQKAISTTFSILQNSSVEKIKQIIENLQILIEWEKQQSNTDSDSTVVSLLLLIREQHLSCITGLLYNTDIYTSMSVMRLLNKLETTNTHLSCDSLLQVSCAVTTLFFNSLQTNDTVLKHECVHICGRYLQDLSNYSTISRKAVIRIMLQRALSKDYSSIFGASICNGSVSQSPRKHLLIDNNVHRSSTVPFHSGTIGQGLKVDDTTSMYSNESQLHNRQLFLDVLLQSCYQCATDVPTTSETDSYFTVGSPNKTDDKVDTPIWEGIPPLTGQTLALLLIELIAPDVMYNGIPWMGEDYIKVTIERDLVVMKCFQENPVLWDIVELTAKSPGSMCFCSSLLRSVSATLMSFWESCRHSTTEECPKQLEASIRLVTVMRKGQLLPPPLSYVSELFRLLSPYEVHLLIANVWKYMKENPPIPDERETAVRMNGCEPRYTEVIRSILHKNIDKCGHVYSRFFH